MWQLADCIKCLNTADTTSNIVPVKHLAQKCELWHCQINSNKINEQKRKNVNRNHHGISYLS